MINYRHFPGSPSSIHRHLLSNLTGIKRLMSSSQPFSLPSLPYDYIALEPYVDTQTMYLHHKQHHQTYVTNLNTALEGKSITDIVQIQKNIDQYSVPVRNNGGGHYNHSLFWKWMAPPGSCSSTISGSLKNLIEEKWGSVDQMKKEFTQAAIKRFGSGWAWLGVAQNGKLDIVSTANQDNPLMPNAVQEPLIPILGLDVWEHAYYLKYQNRRAEYIEKWWNVVNWDTVTEAYEKYASKGKAVPINI